MHGSMTRSCGRRRSWSIPDWISGWLVMVKCTSCFERSPSDSMDNGQRWPHDEALHAWWVEPGRLLAGEYPGSTTPAKAAEKVRLLVEAGVDSIIDLTTPADGLAPYEETLRLAAEEAGRRITHFAYPIPDMGVIDQEGYDRIVA